MTAFLNFCKYLITSRIFSALLTLFVSIRIILSLFDFFWNMQNYEWIMCKLWKFYERKVWIILLQNHKLEESLNFRKFMIRPRQADSQIKEFCKKLEVYSNGAISAIWIISSLCQFCINIFYNNPLISKERISCVDQTFFRLAFSFQHILKCERTVYINCYIIFYSFSQQIHII